MSTFNDIDIECVQCGHEFRGTIWVALHAGQDPELKDLLLGGELNLVSCPECSYVAFQEHFLIYQDPAAELIAYVYPESQRSEETELRKLMLQGFADAQDQMPEKQRLSYDPILLFGLEELIELLNKEEALAEQSQIAQVLCQQNKLPTTVLRPARARQLHTVRVIPHTGQREKPGREDVIAGINRLLEIDPVLDQYAELRTAIQANVSWAL